MRLFRNTALGILLFAAVVLAQNPAPAAVVNPASNIPPSYPFGGIAQGSIFVVYPAFDATGKPIGGPFGPAALATAPALPLTTSLSGTSITVTVGGSTVNAFIVYTLASQVAAVLPSNTPTGTGTLKLTYNGNSGSTSIRVSPSTFGISTVNQSGSGAGVVTFGTVLNGAYPVVTPNNSAKPGDTLVIWGTGLGPANKDNDVATNGDLGTNIVVWVGGLSATITYRGRSGAPGLDQINFVVPTDPNLATGCNVSLAVQTGALLMSNAVTISLAPKGGSCTDPVQSGENLITPLLSKSSTKWSIIDMEQSNGLDATGKPKFDANIDGVLLTFSQQQLNSQFQSFFLTQKDPSLGNCVTTISVNSNSGSNDKTPTATYLDAGAVLTLTPPTGSAISLPGVPGQTGFYNATPTSTLLSGIWKESNGTGGADVTPFSVNFTVPAPVVWSNQVAIVDRTQPFIVKWTGGDPNGWVLITGNSGFGNGNPALNGAASFSCSAPAGPGQFIIPPSALLPLPATQQGFGFLQIQGETHSVITNPGFDISYLQYRNTNTYQPSWK